MKVTILGTGAYGLALSKVLVENKNEVIMWTTFEEEKNELLETRKSVKLNGFELDSNIVITTNLEEAIKKSKLIVIAIPTAFITDVCKEIKKYINNDQYICIASKGIDKDSNLFIYDMIEKEIKFKNVGHISGPTFAVDIVNDVPVGLSLASKNEDTINIIMEAFTNPHFKLFPTDDIIGVEICGAVKNVIAIAAGIIDGMGYPISTKSLFITQALKSITKLIKEFGGYEKTIMECAGFGDILLTCTSEKSRNYSYGKLIGSNSEQKYEYKNNVTIEGRYTLDSIYKLIKDKNIDIPLIDIIYKIVFLNENCQKLIDYIMN